MSNGKATIIFLKVGLIKKILLHKMSYFPKPYNRSKNKIKVELGMSNYAITTELKNPTDAYTLEFLKKTDLASLKSEFDRLDIDKLETIPANLSEVTVVKKEFVMFVMNQLKANAIYTNENKINDAE